MSDEPASVYALTVKFPEHFDLADLAIPVLPVDTVGDLSTTLSILLATQKHTNFGLESHGTDILKFDGCFQDLFAEMGVSDSALTLRFTEKAYTVKTVQEHLLRFRELAGLALGDASATTINSGSTKFGSLELDEVAEPVAATPLVPETETAETAETESAAAVAETKPLTASEREAITALVDSIATPSLAQHAAGDVPVAVTPALKSLALLAWSPVPPAQRLRGDLLYLTLQTLEHETLHVTAHVTGFFVNRSSAATFNPAMRAAAKGACTKSHALFDLVARASPRFAAQVEATAARLAAMAPEAYLPPQTTALSRPWVVAPAPVTADASRAHVAFLAGGADGAEHAHDWNEDYQSVRELPHADLAARIMRERLLAKTSFEFTAAATATAVAIVQGEIAPMNPEDPEEFHIYLRNGIFYSVGGVDAAGQFAGAGGDEAARYAAAKDLAGVRCLNRLDPARVSGLVSAVVDYCGQRIVCQAPVPGILNQSQEEEGTAPREKILYGAAAEGTAIAADATFHELVKPIAEAFHLKEHAVTAGASSGRLHLSRDTKGLRGTDDRNYLIDLYRTTPLDIEFIEAHFSDAAESYPHRETVVRHEAVEEWWRRQVGTAIKEQAQQLEGQKQEQVEGEQKDQEKEQIVVDGSQFALNPDAFPVHAPTDAAEVAQLVADEKDVREVSRFVSVLLTEFVDDVASANGMAPVDGAHLTASLHKAGINMRYLGQLAKATVAKAAEVAAKAAEVAAKAAEVSVEAETKAAADPAADPAADSDSVTDSAAADTDSAKPEVTSAPSAADFSPAAASLAALHAVAVQEMVARASKHVLRALTAKVALPLVPAVISHFHNCLLGGAVNSLPAFAVDSTLEALYACDLSAVARLDADATRALVAAEVFKRFRFQLPADWAAKPVPMMRAIAGQFGIQWKARDYAFTVEAFAELQAAAPVAEKPKKTKKMQKAVVAVAAERTTTFVPEDVANVAPVVKDSIYTSTLTEEILQAATGHIAQDQREVGLTLLGEAIAVYEQIYGPVHPETARGYTLLAQQYQECGLVAEACRVSRKAVYLTERSTGSDSHETVLSLINAAFFEHANGQHVDAFKIYARLLRDWAVIYGDAHPSALTTISNLASILQKLDMPAAAAKLYTRALGLSQAVHGADSQLTGLVHFQFAQLCIMTSLLDEAVSHMEAAKGIFVAHLGAEDSLAKDASTWASNLVNYKAFVDQQEAQKQKTLDAVASGSTAPKHRVKSAAERVAVLVTSKKAKKVKKEVSPDLANQSVEDILAFIEGKQAKHGKQAKKVKA